MTLRQLRERRGLGYSDVEKLSRRLAARKRSPAYVLTKQYLYKIERGGITKPSAEKMIALCTIYGVGAGRLLEALVRESDSRRPGAERSG